MVTVGSTSALIAAGLCTWHGLRRFGTTYGDIIIGLLLIGFGAGLMLPTATNSVIGSVPRGDAGVGSAANTVALQVGGALGVAVVGSIMLTRYQSHLKAVLSGRHVPASVAHTILGSLGGALAVAAGAQQGDRCAAHPRTARTAFMSGNGTALGVAAFVSLGGAVLVLAALPSRRHREPDAQADTVEEGDHGDHPGPSLRGRP